jgi:hypothetical protein
VGATTRIAPAGGKMMDGYLTLEALVGGSDSIIPGYQPLLLKRFAQYKDDPRTSLLHGVLIA